ncbi:protein phtf [Phlebotomus argentipes]|uniref:protein phtf n=1 Tax=Phlebotomus argentipes TaxID=94469 RepID=UPI002892E3DF|nr:protein phtf [Phlebotomus argentipes]XP_059620469.1 protein phtf [Phlebotomus argentipes]XP_059620470.1 protein phtf [Phlebotomus argentipes]XP_059620471.1 protein phtf [Phlebotomus argentipes]
MRLHQIVAWYQKKIGTYDKQQWEKTVEQRILNGFIQVPLKNTKVKTELIDVDLVRGSSFPKAKPKQSLLTVFRLAILRLIFLPLYAKWWVEQTSPRVFAFLLGLYVLQMFTWAVFSFHVNNKEHSGSEHIVHTSELVITMALSLMLSVIHSQIVATASSSGSAEKRKRLLHPKRKVRDRVRRKKKVVRLRPSGVTEEALKTSLNCVSSIETAGSSLRKRNVNWDSPIKSQVVLPVEGSEDNEEASKVADVFTDACESVASPEDVGVVENASRGQTGEDDGFESFNGKSSSGEDNSPTSSPGIPTKEAPNFRNSWVKEVLERVRKNSDSDTDTVKGISSRRNSVSLHLNLKKPVSSESEIDFWGKGAGKKLPYPGQSKKKQDSSDTDEDGEDDGETASTPGTCSNLTFNELTTSATEWIGVTTNSEECSYSSEIDHSDSQNEYSETLECDFTPSVILNPTCGANDRISCTVWDRRDAKKAEMSVLDISSAIIERVEAMPETCDYVYIGVVFSIALSLIPAVCRICEATIDSSNSTEVNFLDVPVLLMETSSESLALLRLAFGESQWEKTVLIVNFVQRICLTYLFFFLLAVAERTFKQRFLYAKLFSHLTSSRRARKSELPHFRLNKVRNIKTWLSVRSYLKRRGPQRSVDVIVSAAFILTLLLLAFLSVEWLKDSPHLHTQYNIEALVWSSALGTYLLRFMTLGTKINRKYRSISVLITEQINLYLQIEQKPNKKEELMVANSVLKLAADLLKELESPFKISGLSANPLLYTTVKVVILSALSGVLSEILGFKLKLHKIKIK